MFCNKCGNIMNDGDKFCKSCGAPAAKPQQTQNNYGYQQNTYQQPQQQSYGYQQQSYQTFQGSPSVSFVDAVRLFFTNLTNFSGRARRSEYWNAALFVYIVNLAIGMIIPDLAFIATAVFLLPQLSLAIRRLHDVGKSGWFYLWIFLPLAGYIIMLIQLLKDSGPDNQWGPNPKY